MKTLKDQYVGDINDYIKYALLRALGAAHAGTLQVCWMRTAPDDRRDGLRLGYLSDPARFRNLDPLVFDALARIVRDEPRTVRAVQRSRILPNAHFHHALLGDGASERNCYFERLWWETGSEDLVFFDPDNGLQVASVPAGRRGSCKYLFWQELERTLELDCSALVYQHFPRVCREAFLERILGECSRRFPAHESFALSTPSVAFLACVPPRRAMAARVAASVLAARLPEYLKVTNVALRLA